MLIDSEIVQSLHVQASGRCIDSGLFMVFLLLHYFMDTCLITVQFILTSVITASTRPCRRLMIGFDVKPAASHVSELVSRTQMELSRSAPLSVCL